MRSYTIQHKFYCGIDLHADWMYLCVIDADGEVRVHIDIRTDPQAFRQALWIPAPTRGRAVYGMLKPPGAFDQEQCRATEGWRERTSLADGSAPAPCPELTGRNERIPSTRR